MAIQPKEKERTGILQVGLEKTVDYFAGRSIDAHVDLRVSKLVEERYIELLREGMVPVVYANHQGHADGMAFAKVAEYLRRLSMRAGCNLRGLAAPMASSWANGEQGKDLKGSYELFRRAGERKGLVGIPATRVRDEEQYEMSREHILTELRPFTKKVRMGYGLADLPEGSIKGGRHPKGSSKDSIYGMQEIRNNSLMGFMRIVSMKDVRLTKQRKPFLAPLALHGSFWMIESPEGDGKEQEEPRITTRGKLSLILGAISLPYGILPLGILRIQANLLMPLTEEHIADELGHDWMEDGDTFNRYAMEQLIPGLPQVAWGVYGRNNGGAYSSY